MSIMGELTNFLGLQIKQVENGTFISQIKYCLEILKEFDMQNSKSISTLMASNVLIDKDEIGVEIDITKYRGIIGFLLYLTTNMPYIMFSVCMCSRFQASPKESHFKIVKGILRYLNGTSHHDLWFLKGNKYNLVGFFILIFMIVSRIGKTLVVLVICFVIVWFLGVVRRNTMLLFLSLRLSM